MYLFAPLVPEVQALEVTQRCPQDGSLGANIPICENGDLKME